MDKELRVFPKLQFIIRFNVNVSLYILPYVIVKMIMQAGASNGEIIDQIYEEFMSVIQLNQLVAASASPASNASTVGIISTTTTTTTNACASTTTITNSTTSSSNGSISNKMLPYHNICCQTVFNIYDHLVRQLNYYRGKMTELQATLNSRTKMSSTRNAGGGTGAGNANSTAMLAKYKEQFELFNKFTQRIPHAALSKAAAECKAFCRSLRHYELHMRATSTPGAPVHTNATVNIRQEHLVELQHLYASMDEIDAASGILLLKKGSEESLADAAFRHKINGRLNESIACIEQMLESNEAAKNDIRQHETYVRTFISIGRHRNALSYLEGLMMDRGGEWKDALDSYRIEACWKLGSWDKLKQIVSSGGATANAALLDTTSTQHVLGNLVEQRVNQSLVSVVTTSHFSNISRILMSNINHCSLVLIGHGTEVSFQ